MGSRVWAMFTHSGPRCVSTWISRGFVMVELREADAPLWTENPEEPPPAQAALGRCVSPGALRMKGWGQGHGHPALTVIWGGQCLEDMTASPILFMGAVRAPLIGSFSARLQVEVVSVTQTLGAGDGPPCSGQGEPAVTVPWGQGQPVIGHGSPVKVSMLGRGGQAMEGTATEPGWSAKVTPRGKGLGVLGQRPLSPEGPSFSRGTPSHLFPVPAPLSVLPPAPASAVLTPTSHGHISEPRALPPGSPGKTFLCCPLWSPAEGPPPGGC